MAELSPTATRLALDHVRELRGGAERVQRRDDRHRVGGGDDRPEHEGRHLLNMFCPYV